MNGIAEALATTPIPTLLIGILLLALTALFAVIFVGRGAILMARLGKAAAALRKVKDPKIETVRQILSSDRTLAHLCTEYMRTLHRPREAGIPGKDTREFLSIHSSGGVDLHHRFDRRFSALDGILQARPRHLHRPWNHRDVLRTDKGASSVPGVIRHRRGQEWTGRTDAPSGRRVLRVRHRDHTAMAATLIERLIVTHIYKHPRT